MAGVGFLESLWENQSGRALNPVDSVFTHSIHGMECAREVRAAWRALFLPDPAGAGDGAGQ